MAYSRQDLSKDILLNMGHGIIDVELDPEHINLAITMAFDRYRQRSQNAQEESFLFITLLPDTQTYTLPDEVMEVRNIYRRNMSATGGGGSSIDPFSMSYINSLYMIGRPGGFGAGAVGMLATYELANGFQKLVGTMFGQDLMFKWNVASKKLFIERKFVAPEEVLLHIYNRKPDEMLLADDYARVWLRDWATAKAKHILAQARGKFGALAGPQGGITLNGEALKIEATEEMTRLEDELKNFVDSHYGMPIIIA